MRLSLDAQAQLAGIRERTQALGLRVNRPWWFTAIMVVCVVWMLYTLFHATSLFIWCVCMAWALVLSLQIGVGHLHTLRVKKTVSEVLDDIDENLEFEKAKMESLRMMQKASEMLSLGNQTAGMLMMQESVRLLQEHATDELPPEMQELLALEIPVEGGVQ
tara:strand:+ start:1164 stop:1646 length:483 start_codon:yes stop_codon:yes gene_type:complete